MQRTLILGGGLAGLRIAYELEKLGHDYLLIEARDRLGGRILSATPSSGENPHELAGYDLGPAWFWPGQNRMRALVRELGLEDQVFEQYAEGDGLVEIAPGQVHRGSYEISMAGSYRLVGGMGSLVRALARRVDRVRLGTWGTSIERTEQGIRLGIEGSDGKESLEGSHLVLTLPPRVALNRLRFDPPLRGKRKAALGRIATWMASSAKCVALYAEPFWRDAGLSGDAFSQVGPLGEIHDASPPQAADGPAALFGFFALPPEIRRRHADELADACIAQFRRLFGEAAGEPLGVFVRDWAFDPRTTTADDLRGPAVHSLVALEPTTEAAWEDRLIWSGSETASPAERLNGYLEGALAASERTLGLLGH